MKPEKHLLLRAFFVPLLFIMVLNTYSQSVEGDWYGSADVGGIVLRITLHVKSTADGYSSTWDSPDQGAMGIPSTTTTFKFPDFSFSHAGAGFRYTGQVNSSYTEIKGTLEQAGKKFEIIFGRKELEAAPGSPEALRQKYDKMEVYITMRDGIKLFTSIYTPKKT
jgi:hypothetical protein